MQRYEVIRNFLADLRIEKDRLHGSGPYPCPLHVSKNHTLLPMLCDGALYFRCTKCRFVGTPEQLIKETDSVKPVKNMARIKDRLYDGIKDVALRSRYDDEKQYLLQDYLRRCRSRFSRLNVGVLSKLTSMGVNKLAVTTWLDCCGLVAKDAPPPLKEIKKEIFVLSDYVTFPFFRGNVLTHLDVYNPATEDYHHIRVTPGCEGIFLERELTWPVVESVVVCPTPVGALSVYSKYREFTPKSKNVISVTAPSALRFIPSLQRVDILSPEDQPLPLSEALHYCRVSRSGKFETFVCKCAPLASIPDRALRTLDSVPTRDYIRDEVAEAWKTGGRNRVVELMSNNPFTEPDRAELCGGLDDKELQEVVRSVICATTEVTLGSVKIRRDTKGFKVIGDEDDRLTNFSVYADHCTDNARGQIMISGHVRTDQPEDGLIPFLLPDSAFSAKGGAFGKNMWKACVKSGTSCSFFSKSLPRGLDWLSVIRSMDHLSYHPGVHKLGANEDRIQFPDCYVDVASKTVCRTVGLTTVSERARSSFSGIVCSTSYSYDVIKKLLSSEESALQAFVSGLGHVIHSLILPTARPHSPRQHLLFHSMLGEDSLWAQTLKQLSEVFSPAGTRANLAPHRWKATAMDPDSGNMPLFGIFDEDVRHVPEVFQESPRPIVATAPTNVISRAITEPTVSSIQADVDCFHDGAQALVLPDDAIAELRAALPYLLRDVLAKASPSELELDADVPAEAGVRWLERITGQEAHASTLDLVDSYQILAGVNTADVFIRALKTLIRSHACSVVQSLHAAVNRYESIGYLDEDTVVLWQKRSVGQANKVCDNRFSPVMVTEALQKEYGWQESSRAQVKCWEIPKQQWEDLMKDRPILQLVEDHQPVTAVL